MQETHVQPLDGEDPPAVGNGNPLQYSCLENPKDRGAWRATVHGVPESDRTEHTCRHTLKGNTVRARLRKEESLSQNHLRDRSKRWRNLLPDRARRERKAGWSYIVSPSVRLKVLYETQQKTGRSLTTLCKQRATAKLQCNNLGLPREYYARELGSSGPSVDPLSFCCSYERCYTTCSLQKSWALGAVWSGDSAC